MLNNSNLRVTVFWGDVIYDTALVPPKASLTVGREMSNSFILDLDPASRSSKVELVTVHPEETAEVKFDDGIDGVVTFGKEVLSLESAKKSKYVSRDADGFYRLMLSKSDKADIVIGHVTFSLDWERERELIPRAAPDRRRGLLLWSLALLGVLGMIVVISSWTPPEEEREKPPERMVTLVRSSPHAKAAIGEVKTRDGGAQKGELGKAELQPRGDAKLSAAAQLKKANLGSLVSGLSNLGSNVAPEAGGKGGGNAAIRQAGTGGFSTEGLKTGGGGKSVGIGRTLGQGEGGFEGTGRLGLSGNSLLDGSGGRGVTTPEGGGLDREVIESIIRRRQDRIRLCYERQLNFHPKLSGKIAVHFVIGKTGNVLGCDIVEDTMKNSAISSCIISEVKSWTFPAPTGGTQVNVQYPFAFESSAQTGN